MFFRVVSSDTNFNILKYIIVYYIKVIRLVIEYTFLFHLERIPGCVNVHNELHFYFLFFFKTFVSPCYNIRC